MWRTIGIFRSRFFKSELCNKPWLANSFIRKAHMVIIRQQPDRGRKIGFAKTKSFIYPELIVEYHGSENSVCHIAIQGGVHHLQREDVMYEILVGSKVQSPRLLHDPEDGNQRLFFVFSDLCIRIEGEFVLEMTIVDMDTKDVHKYETNAINVVSSNRYRGIDEPSKLAKSFSIQGVRTAGRRYKVGY